MVSTRSNATGDGLRWAGKTAENSKSIRGRKRRTTTPRVENSCAVNGSQIDIVSGPISCGDAYATAGRYLTDSEKYQQIDAFTCYSGNAMTAPVTLNCVSDASEFAVSTIPLG